MKVGLMFPDGRALVPYVLRRHDLALIQDLGLDTLVAAMGGDDEFLREAARGALLAGDAADVATIRFRQEVMRDALAHPDVVRALYALAVEAFERSRRGCFSYIARSPGSTLWGSVSLLGELLDVLRQTRALALRDGGGFSARGFREMFDTIRDELDAPYLDNVAQHLRRLKFPHGTLLSARLGPRNEGQDYVVRAPTDDRPRWLQRLTGSAMRGFSFRIDERDEAGARALSELRDRGLREVASAVGQAASHVLGFFHALRRELAFYVAALNLHERVSTLGCPTCFPDPAPAADATWTGRGLRDIGLVLRTAVPVVPNDLDASGRRLLVVTGANQGGKSSFLRAIGLAQLMMQAGMFVAAERYAAAVRRGVFTHYRREEDATMTMGKFDEELDRLSTVVEALGPGALLLMNESFATTNEREGAEVARQVVTTLPTRGVTVVFVTHLAEFSRTLFDERRDDTLFLRAERLADGTRTFRVVPGAPLETSYGPDLYEEIFGQAGGRPDR
ncbi:MAG: DNA mismatch repair protein MutS [Gemmatimonadota bacterium]|nr:DNA mismatch repair protein MutS [Gemmatimonadota bacterium]